MIIDLSKNNPSRWYNSGTVNVCGYLFDEKSTLCKDQTLADYFNTGILIERLQNANGNFALIQETDTHLYFSVDHMRSIPLFYALDSSNELIISDNPYFIKDTLNLSKTNPEAVSEFLLCGFVSYRETLFKEIKQVLAGELVIYSKTEKAISIQSFFKYKHQENLELTNDDLIEELDKVHVSIFKRLIASLDNKTVVIPLSGGYDSRLVAVMLKRLGYENVICFSYGKKNNKESRVSRSVAEYLGFKWLFIEHDRKSWYKAFSGDLRKIFYKFTNNLSCNAHIQDYLAVLTLKEKDLIPSDSIFIPGHSADFLEGSHLPESFNNREQFNKNDLVESILKFHYYYWKWDKHNSQYSEYISNKINKQLMPPDTMNREEISAKFEEWDWQERQSKFICNAVRVYEFFDYNWRLPLWDKELMNYWSQIPFSKRYKRTLYYEYVAKKQNIPVMMANKPITIYERIINKIIRMALGDVKEIRYGRYINPQNILKFRNAKVSDISPEKETLPDFVNTQQSIFNTPINALHALISLKELNQ